MKQSKLASMSEAVINTLAGFVISLAAQWYFLPLLGVSITFQQNLLFAVIMTFVSIARGFIFRRIFEALHIRVPMSPAMVAVFAERRRQEDVEGWTKEHDDGHRDHSLSQAAACYALAHNPSAGFANVLYHDPLTGGETRLRVAGLWPWDPDWWKPMDRRRNLVRAGALIVAEIERVDRLRKRNR